MFCRIVFIEEACICSNKYTFISWDNLALNSINVNLAGALSAQQAMYGIVVQSVQSVNAKVIPATQ